MTTCSHGKTVNEACEICTRVDLTNTEHNRRVEDIRRCKRNHMAMCRARGIYTNDRCMEGRR